MSALYRFVAVLTVLIILVVPLVQVGAADQPEYVVPVILSMTGSYAFSGHSDAEGLKIFENYTNAHGGIRGQKLHFVVYDDQSSPATDVSLAGQIIAQHPAVVLGSDGGSLCNAMMSLFKDGPVLYCLVPTFYPAKGSYIFAATVALDPFIAGMIRYLRLRGFDHIAVISPTDGSGQANDISIAHALTLPDNKNMKIVAYEHFNNTDLSVSAQATQIKASDAQAVLVLAAGTSLGTVLRSFNDVGLSIPVETTPANLHADQLAQYLPFYPKQLVIPGLAYMIPPNAPKALGPTPAMKKSFDQLFDAYKMANAQPDPGATSNVWDPANMVVNGLRKLGPGATGSQLRDYLLGIHGTYSGIWGDYDFSNGDQHGLSDQGVVLTEWDPKSGKFVGVSGLRGTPLPK
jgi:ABC-type branched-subunit amino acid transport system substrate-binding protein